MAWLHENRETFYTAVNLAADKYNVLPVVVEKDYYVTMVLRGLAARLEYVVFKGGTSLSKCHKVINRFSEDIDITIDKKISQGEMKKLKMAIKDIAEELNLRIPNIDETRSRRSYNRYILEYDSVLGQKDDAIQTAVLMETSFAEVSFPTVVLPVHSYIGDMMSEEAPDQIENNNLSLFDMKVQGIDRTLADKVFAVCDYYLQDRVKKHSRHLYDIYKLLLVVSIDESFRKLVHDVRLERAKTSICPSSQPEVDVQELLNLIIEKEIYKDDYESITVKLLEEAVPYDVTVAALKKIVESGMFEELQGGGKDDKTGD